MSFSEIRHQDRAVRALQRALAADRVPHGFIFCGPPGVGKALTARALAKVLLCDAPKTGRAKAPTPRACGKCPQCRLADRHSHPDLNWFTKPPGSAGFPVGVVTRRDDSPLAGPTINESAQLTAMQARCRVTVIEDAEWMTRSAANAFLKTFEEAPDGSYLILLVTSLDRLLPTIRSRGRLIRFGTLPEEFIAELLQRDHARSAADALTLARFAEGSIRVAASLARSQFLDLRRETMRILPALDRAAALGLADAIGAWAAEQADDEAQLEADEDARIKDKKKAKVEQNTLKRLYLKRALAMLAGVFRDAVLARAGRPDSELQNADAAAFIRKLADALPPETAQHAVRRCLQYQTFVDYNVHIQLLLENACLETADWLAAART